MTDALNYSGMKSRHTLKAWAIQGKIIGKKGPGGHWVFDLESIDHAFTPTIQKKAIDIIRSLSL